MPPKQKFTYQKKWETDNQLKDWIKPVAGKETEAYCAVCECKLLAKKRDLIAHGKTTTHSNKILVKELSNENKEEISSKVKISIEKPIFFPVNKIDNISIHPANQNKPVQEMKLKKEIYSSGEKEIDSSSKDYLMKSVIKIEKIDSVYKDINKAHRKTLPSINCEPVKIECSMAKSLSHSPKIEKSPKNVHVIKVNTNKISVTEENISTTPLNVKKIIVRNETSDVTKTLKDGVLYKCAVCGSQFSEIATLKEHNSESHPLNKLVTMGYVCSLCSIEFDSMKSLVIHLRHHIHREYNCAVCNIMFKNFSSYGAHIKVHNTEMSGDLTSGVKKYKCGECDVTFISKSEIRAHILSHNNVDNIKGFVDSFREDFESIGENFNEEKSDSPKKIKINHCGENSRILIEEKSEPSIKIKVYLCRDCHKQFREYSSLKKHQKEHRVRTKFKCEQCSNIFYKETALKRHMLIHSGEKPFACEFCPMTFQIRSNLQRHVTIHTGERPYKCDLCPTAFRQAIDLKRHKISHTGIKPFKCEECDAAFSRKNNLKWHMLTHSQNPEHKCGICDAGFSSTRDLKAHIKTHNPDKQFKCDSCPVSFSKVESLYSHKMIHTGEKPFKVKSDCSHPKPKPFMCPFCNSTFVERRNLKRHAYSIHSYISEFTDVPLVIDEHITSNLVEAVVESNLESSHFLDNDLNIQNNEFDTTQSNAVSQSHQQQTNEENQQGEMHEILIATQNSDPKSQLLLVPGQDTKPGRLAGDCQNHSQHVTLIDGNTNNLQTWCFCDSPNIPHQTVTIPLISSVATSISGTSQCQPGTIIDSAQYQSAMVDNKPIIMTLASGEGMVTSMANVSNFSAPIVFETRGNITSHVQF